MLVAVTIRERLSDTAVIVGRCLRHALRSTDTVITAIAMPVAMMFLFVYVFGGAIDTGSVSYVNFVVPGILILCIGQASPYTALRLNNDVTKGIIDRFRSMPIAQSALLTGHVVTAVVFTALSTALLMLFALAMGFRPAAGLAAWLLAVGILFLFTLAMTWVAAVFGLLAKTAEGSVAYSYPITILLFISSAFAPTGSMPRLVRWFAEHQPLTSIVESVRSLLLNGAAGQNALTAILWCLGIIVVSAVAAAQLYRRRMA